MKKNLKRKSKKTILGLDDQGLWKIVENTKVVHYFDNSKGIFFFEAKISTVWMQIKFKIHRQVEGATCQCQTGACEYYNSEFTNVYDLNTQKIGADVMSKVALRSRWCLRKICICK